MPLLCPCCATAVPLLCHPWPPSLSRVAAACALRGDSEATPSTPRSDAARLAAARASHADASERAASELVRVRVRVRVNPNPRATHCLETKSSE